MVKVEICGPNDRALEQVLEPSNTQILIRKPAMAPCFICVEADEPSALIVEVDGAEINAVDLEPGRHALPLQSTLVAPRSASKLLALVPGVGRTRHQPSPAAFTLSVRSGNRDGSLLGTYNYRLVGEHEYDEAYGRISAEIDSRPAPVLFTTDQHSPEEHLCWNCHAPVTDQYCQKCGYDQAEHEETSTN